MQPPDRLDCYEIIRVLGEGGMGTVYLARDAELDRLVAIKLLRDGIDTPVERARLKREARAAARLNHPNIVTIFRVDEEDSRPYVVMEFVEGLPLTVLVRDRIPTSLAARLGILEGICAGLASAHEAGLIHRDIKPANVIVAATGEPKLLDFGLAMLSDASSRLTREHAVVGTLSYMSPEQLTAGTVDARSDLHSVAVLAYELLSFRRAYTGDTRQVIGKILSGTPDVPVDGLHVDESVRRILRKGLQPDPTQRFQSARQLAQALREARLAVQDDSCVEQTQVNGVLSAAADPNLDVAAAPRHPVRLVLAGTALVALTGGLSYVLSRPAETSTRAVSPVEESRPDATASPQPPSAFRPEPEFSPPSEFSRQPEFSSQPRFSTETAFRGASQSNRTGGREMRVPLRDPVSKDEEPVHPATAPGNVAGPVDSQSHLGTPPVRSRLPVGTELLVRVTSVLDSRNTRPGDRFTGVLDAGVDGTGDGHLAAGSDVEGRVEQAGYTGAAGPFLQLSVTGLAVGGRVVPVRTGFYRAVAPRPSAGPSFAAIVLGGTLGGAAGALLGGRDGLVAGGAIGSAIGAGRRVEGSAEYRIENALPFKIAEAVYLDGPK